MDTITIPEMKDIIATVAVELNIPCGFWGPPGCGKTQGAEQVAREMGWFYHDWRAGQHDTVDMKGYPGPDKSKKFMDWLPAKNLPIEGNDAFPDDRTILFSADELNSATPPVMGVLYQMFQERRVGDRPLKSNVRLIAMGNRDGDRGVTNRVPLPLCNRMAHFEAAPSVAATTDHWAKHGLVDPIFVAFLHFRKPLFTTFDPTKPDKAFATARSWENFAKVYGSGARDRIKKAAGAGLVGDGPAAELFAFEKVWAQVDKIIPKIKADPETAPIPGDDKQDLAYAIAVAVSGEMGAKNADTMGLYLDRMEPEFCVLAWNLAVSRDGELFSTDGFYKFAMKYRTAHTGA